MVSHRGDCRASPFPRGPHAVEPIVLLQQPAGQSCSSTCAASQKGRQATAAKGAAAQGVASEGEPATQGEGEPAPQGQKREEPRGVRLGRSP